MNTWPLASDGDACPLRRDKAAGDRCDAGFDHSAMSIGCNRFLLLMMMEESAVPDLAC